MPTKTTPLGVEYEVTGKTFVWHPADDDDERGNLPPVTIPMRIKLRTIRVLSGELDAGAMFQVLETLIPDQTEALDEMDMNDFIAMFSTWQDEYTALSGVDLGESPR
jgi:hypothetical protein